MKKQTPQEIAKEEKLKKAAAAKAKADAKEAEEARVAAVAAALDVPEAERTEEQIALIKQDEEIKANPPAEDAADDEPEIKKKGTLPKEMAVKTASDGKSQQIV